MSEIALTREARHTRHGSNIGQPMTRREGVLKVTGAARFAADNHPPGMLYAVLAVSSVARGRLASLDVAAAKAHPGVSIGSYPSMTPAGFRNQIVVRGREPEALAAARTEIEALIVRLQAERN